MKRGLPCVWVGLAGLTGPALAQVTAPSTPPAAPTAPPVSAATSTERPLWELGMGVGGLRLPHYRGSDQSHNWLLPVPYVVYRGDILKADRDGARALLVDTDRFEFDLSLAASAPTRSRDNEARRGMSDLAPTVELGPNANVTLAHGTGWKLDLRAPLRTVLTLESHPKAIGWIATPNINLDVAQALGHWNLGLLAGPVFGSRKLHGYFYDVPIAYATAARPAYQAPGGAAGAQLLAAVSRRDGNRWMGGFVKFDTVRGARFADSPLVRQRDQVSVGFAVSWVLTTSSRTVRVSE